MPKAVVLLSGGLDSATTLALARTDGFECYALSVDYGQRHRAELVAAKRVADALGACQYRVVAAGLQTFGGSALTDRNLAVPTAGASAGTDDGRACGACDACRIRRQGFQAAGVADPTRYVAPPAP